MKPYHLYLSLLLLLIYGSPVNYVYKDSSQCSIDMVIDMNKNRQTLFYIERSKNKNRVYYDANINLEGTINNEQPIDVYWINLEEEYGKRKELTYIQEKFAYGYRFTKINDRLFEIKLKAFQNRPMLLLFDSKGMAKIQMRIQKKQAHLHRVYIKAIDRGIATKVEYVELYGIDIVTRAEIYEKLYP